MRSTFDAFLRHRREFGWRSAIVRVAEVVAERTTAAAAVNAGEASGVTPRAARHSRMGGQRTLPAPTRRVLLCAHVASRMLFGSERSFLDMADGLGAIGAEVIAAVPPGTAPAYCAALQQRCAAVFLMPLPWWNAATPEDETLIAEFCELIAAECITHVHANTIMLREPIIAARRMGIPAIIHARELVRHDPALVARIGASPAEIEAAVHARADRIIANSETTRRAFTHPNAKPVLLVTNTAEVAELAALPRRAPGAPLRVGMISSNLPKKGLASFAALAEHLAAQDGIKDDERPDGIRLRLIGPRNEHVTALDPRIEVLGYIEDPLRAMAELDLVLSLSEFHESFGRTVLEAQAAGRPAIVWDRGAPPEIVLHGRTGYVIPPGDIAALAETVQHLARDRNLYDTMAEEARTHTAQTFGSDQYAAQMRAAYDDIDAGFVRAPLTLRARGDIVARPRDSMRIGYFVWHFPVRSETFVLNELRALQALGHDVRVFCKGSPQPDFSPDFDIQWENVRNADHLAQRLTETGRTICHAHFVYPTVTDMLWPACEKAAIPFTFIAHAQDIFRYANDAKNRISEIARSPFCRRVFVPSRFHRDYLSARGVPVSQIMLNANGCDYRLYAAGRVPGRAARPFRRVTAVHRFTEKKGLSHLIRAARLLEADGIVIAIHGYGECEAEYRRIIAAEKITNVELHGPVIGREGLLAVFRGSDLFACPSVRAADGDMDGIPTVLMEAMSAGLPVLSSALSGIPDLVEDGVTGLVTAVTAEAIAARIRAYYAMPEPAVAAMIDNALERIVADYDTDLLTDSLLRVWANESLDLMIVAWNNLPEITEVISRLYRNTGLPFHLVVCDNGSDAPTLAHLLRLQVERDNMTLVLNRSNALVGPGTNICLAEGAGEFAVYVCGKEGMTTGPGWERSVIAAMRHDPRIGLAGTLCYSPSYLRGRDYAEKLAPFPKFRNRKFAHDNPDRVFAHVQGGFFILRRAMVDEIGGFSEDVPHNHTDVEYSYYVESTGWRLGEVAGLMALYNKTRPGLMHRIDEHHLALHPPLLGDLPKLDRIARREVSHCNVCGLSSLAFIDPDGSAVCPYCRSDRRARSLFRALAESTLLYRRLPALGVDLPEGIRPFWKEQFQGGMLTSTEIARQGSSGFADGRLQLAGLGNGPGAPGVLEEAARVVAPGGVLLVAGATDPAATDARALALNLVPVRRARYASVVVKFDWPPILIYHRSGPQDVPSG